MDWSLWLRALLLAIMLDALFVFIAPEKYQAAARHMSTMDPERLRIFGLCAMLACLFTAWFLP